MTFRSGGLRRSRVRRVTQYEILTMGFTLPRAAGTDIEAMNGKTGRSIFIAVEDGIHRKPQAATVRDDVLRALGRVFLRKSRDRRAQVGIALPSSHRVGSLSILTPDFMRAARLHVFFVGRAGRADHLIPA
jgi:hypothetical protein